MKTKKRKAGRPPLPKNQIKGVITLRVTPAEREEYESRARKGGLRLSDWIRESLNRAVRDVTLGP